jgi:hypothetical protein
VKLLRQSNRWSCLPTAFAMAAGLSFETLIERIGHDGSEIIWPDLPEPQRRRAFHIQECINAVALDWGVTPFELIGRISPNGVLISEINFQYPKLDTWTGVALGLGMVSGNRHAVAFCNGEIFDPNGLRYDFEIKSGSRFKPELIYRFDLISQDIVF